MILLTLLTQKTFLDGKFFFFFFCSLNLRLWNQTWRDPWWYLSPCLSALVSQSAEQEEVDISEEPFSFASPHSFCCFDCLPWFVSLGGLCCQHPLIPIKSYQTSLHCGKVFSAAMSVSCGRDQMWLLVMTFARLRSGFGMRAQPVYICTCIRVDRVSENKNKRITLDLCSSSVNNASSEQMSWRGRQREGLD